MKYKITKLVSVFKYFSLAWPHSETVLIYKHSFTG